MARTREIAESRRDLAAMLRQEAAGRSELSRGDGHEQPVRRERPDYLDRSWIRRNSACLTNV